MAKTTKKRKWVYFFGNGKADGTGDMREVLGGKGAGLAEMTRIGLPVPGGFTITTEACAAYSAAGKSWPTGLEKEVRANLKNLEKSAKRKLGDAKNPLLVSVRSGAARSMPGMMETILNLGLNDRSVEGLAKVSGSRRFALDAYRRFIMMYGSTARGVKREHFDNAFDEIKNLRTRPRLGRAPHEKVVDTDVDEHELEELVERFKEIFRNHTDDDFPQDPFEQLRGAIDAVFDSWMAEKAVTYRRVEKITGLTGTAVNVCQMVFGNMGEDSGTGVCFTRDPSTGAPDFYGDMLINAQGEDVVAGVRTPLKLAELETRMPDVYEQLEAVRVMLEVHYKEMQDLEFTIERGTLYMLQCRTGKRSPQAAFKIAVDQATKPLLTAAAARKLVRKKYLPKRYATAASKPIITKDDAIRRITAADIERLFYPVLDPDTPIHELESRFMAEGIGAVPGAAVGRVAFSAEEAEARAERQERVVLVRKETSPEDVGGMHVSSGILTATGGKTSHAAVVARGWGKCCIVGCDNLNIDYNTRQMSVNGRVIREGDFVTLDGGTGRVYHGEINLVQPQAPPEYNTLMEWCDRRRRLKVRTNADTPQDASRAVELGAEGIGLCRTEHMFFDASQPQRIRAMREMILADSESARRAALDKLLPFQRTDFEGIFTAMDGKPVTVRLLDPPLHEFLPQHDNPEGQQAVVDDINAPIQERLDAVPEWDNNLRNRLLGQLVTVDDIRRRVEQLHEANPMLGHRGCRLCITYPEILEMQVRAIMEAAVNCQQRGISVLPEIMIPLTIDPKELALLAERTRTVADGVLDEAGVKLNYLVGTMIETPRAALVSDELAETAEFFSFGTNDLTQMTMGLSRDDAGRFLPYYVDENKAGIFHADPFQSLDTDGVGVLVFLACEQGRETRTKIKLGICGEHGGDPASIGFCEQVELDYVSCSPFRVPIARLAAAQATIAQEAERKAAGRGARGKKLKGPTLLKSNSKPRETVMGKTAKASTKTSKSSKKKGKKSGKKRK
ncbi:MAG: pyruvate, phosphate dikinase [Phycisphaerae bacterium]|nr:pyruvate, phosphate dikinase [Phycisphaerae bacterium]